MQVKINGSKIYYTEGGNPAAASVVFIHGFPFSSAIWKDQLKALGNNYHSVAYDFRGMGNSALGDGQYTLEGHVDDLIAMLDYLEIEQAIVVGLSMGGYIALRALERNPERFLGVVLCDTQSKADDNTAKLKRAAGAKAVKQDGAAAFAEGFVGAVFTQTSLESNVPAVGFIKDLISATNPLAIAGNLIAMAGRTDTTDSLQNISIPTLILVGEEDNLTTPDTARAMHAQIKGSELHLIPQAAHMSHLENPEVFNARLLEFLQKI
ncbi:MAG: alpha/beta hydrolase [Desulfuromonadaceae bacterium]|nr:alpha/beta hydrolase [Desulfuromonadaceae bacterium]